MRFLRSAEETGSYSGTQETRAGHFQFRRPLLCESGADLEERTSRELAKTNASVICPVPFRAFCIAPLFLNAGGTPPAFQHAINLVSHRIAGFHPAYSAHEEPIVFRMPVANGRDHRCS